MTDHGEGDGDGYLTTTAPSSQFVLDCVKGL
jgi:hypothetical protein